MRVQPAEHLGRKTFVNRMQRIASKYVEIEEEERNLVSLARNRWGMSDAEIAIYLGVTRQAVQQRFPK